MGLISSIFDGEAGWIKEINKDLHEETAFFHELEKSSHRSVAQQDLEVGEIDLF